MTDVPRHGPDPCCVSGRDPDPAPELRLTRAEASVFLQARGIRMKPARAMTSIDSLLRRSSSDWKKVFLSNVRRLTGTPSASASVRPGASGRSPVTSATS